MGHFLAKLMRRAACTSFVLFALFLACVPAQAAPCAPCGNADTVQEHIVHAALAADDHTGNDDIDPTPSIEDNTVSLDDTFDVPPDHALPPVRTGAIRPAALMLAPHAHHHSFELRPPIA